MAEHNQGARFAAWTFYIFKFKCPMLPLPFCPPLLSFFLSLPTSLFLFLPFVVKS